LKLSNVRTSDRERRHDRGLWRDPDGVLHDIAPRYDGTTRILFLPAPTASYEHRQINNIRQTLSEAPDVQELIAAHNDRYRFLYGNQQPGQPSMGIHLSTSLSVGLSPGPTRTSYRRPRDVPFCLNVNM